MYTRHHVCPYTSSWLRIRVHSGSVQISSYSCIAKRQKCVKLSVQTDSIAIFLLINNHDAPTSRKSHAFRICSDTRPISCVNAYITPYLHKNVKVFFIRIFRCLSVAHYFILAVHIFIFLRAHIMVY